MVYKLQDSLSILEQYLTFKTSIFLVSNNSI